MNPLITFETPKSYVLQGAWLGKSRAKTVYIFLHGLTGNLFSRSDTAFELTKSGAVCLMFNNRGHDHVTRLRQKSKTADEVLGGAAHEIFTDSRDDIAGAVAFARSRGAKRIILVGHSTGCQKAIWYLAGKPAREVTGAVLLAPLSDYASMKAALAPVEYAKLRAKVELLAKKDSRTIVPQGWLPFPSLTDAQRWLSLYTPESKEEIFTYASGRTPTTLRKTSVPLLALFASDDEYADRPAKELAAWFSAARPKQPIDARVVVAPNHGFSGRAKALAKLISRWQASF